MPTIPQLFRAPQAPPQGLSAWDQAFLGSLYHTSQANMMQAPATRIGTLKSIAPKTAAVAVATPRGLSPLVGLLEHRGQPAIAGDHAMLEVPVAVALDEFIVLAALLDDLRQRRH